MNRKAYVYVQNMMAGILEETDLGYKFVYDSEYLKSQNALAVSLTLPLQTKTLESNFLFPFFDGLIPEGWLLQKIAENWKIEQKDRFGILLIACQDSIGDVSIKPFNIEEKDEI